MAGVSRRSSSFAGTRFNAKKATKAQKAAIRTAKVEAVTGKTYVAEAVKESTTINNCINAIRFLSIDGVNAANSGHPGLPMGCAPMSYVLWGEEMKYNPKNPKFFNRDRFVLSAGHGSMLQYSLLHLCGFDSVSVSALPPSPPCPVTTEPRRIPAQPAAVEIDVMPFRGRRWQESGSADPDPPSSSLCSWRT